MPLSSINLNMPMNYMTAIEISELVNFYGDGFVTGKLRGKLVTITVVMDMLIFRVEGEITNYWLQSLNINTELKGKNGKLIDLF